MKASGSKISKSTWWKPESPGVQIYACQVMHPWPRVRLSPLVMKLVSPLLQPCSSASVSGHSQASGSQAGDDAGSTHTSHNTFNRTYGGASGSQFLGHLLTHLKPGESSIGVAPVGTSISSLLRHSMSLADSCHIPGQGKSTARNLLEQRASGSKNTWSTLWMPESPGIQLCACHVLHHRQHAKTCT